MTAEPTHPFVPDEGAPALKARLRAMAMRAKAVLTAYRVPIFVAAAILFVGGTAVSVSRLELSLADIDLMWIALASLVFVPLSMVYGAVNFMVMARGAGHRVPFWRSLKISCVAVFAEFLPIPGGALVRGAAMMSHGSGAASAAAHVTVNAVLWIACAALAAAFSLGITNPVAMTIGAGGLTGVVGCSWWLATRAGIGVALAALALRMIGLVFAGLRLLAAFMAIGIVTGFIDLYPFVFATILGSAASIAPGGLGISEIVAAGIATLSTIPPEAAFVAVGLNRVIGFAVSGIATGIITLFFADQRTTQ